ncbi:SAM-dependent methyltransferase [Kitasatospora sp. NPDC004723]|uniref:SAM-dependent methyltransferase n=1 Tax=Kitasatospora sp. NPDC004723 TaxID=3154288 RepID=UPI0033AAE25D
MLGSGIRAIGQFSLEAQAYLKWADKVYYCVSDPATEQWILDQQPDSVDLYTLYDNDKPRRITYIQMAELMLRSVREGLNVVGVFYGHPGVFVNPSHRAIAIARQEGHAAFMLPAVSALDCLFADLGIDPSRPGCQIVEATDLLVRRRPLLVDSHVILLQVGSVGDVGFKFSGFPNAHLGVLVRYLQAAYGEDYEIINYIASQYSIADPVIQPIALSKILDPDTRPWVTGISTFYVPPKVERAIDLDMATSLGLRLPDRKPPQEVPRATSTGPFAPYRVPYSDVELQYIAQLDSHRTPDDYRQSRPPREFYEMIRNLALEPALLARYLDDPEAFLGSGSGMSERTKEAVVTGNYGWIRTEFQRSEDDVARTFVTDALTHPGLAVRYQRMLSAAADRNDSEALDEVRKGLQSLGYDTAPGAIAEAFNELSSDGSVWAGGYHLFVDGGPARELLVGPDGVLLDGTALNGARFDAGVLTWNERDDNTSSGSLRFSVPVNPAGGEPRPDSYTGPQCHGVIWTGAASDAPARDNVHGKVGVYTVADAADPFAADPAEAWAGTYETRIASSAGWQTGPALTLGSIGADGGRPQLECDGQPVTDPQYADGVLGWTQPEPLWSGSITFFTHQPDGEGPGPVFLGRLWRRASEPGALKISAVGQKVDHE